MNIGQPLDPNDDNGGTLLNPPSGQVITANNTPVQLNFVLGGRVTLASGQLKRPWPDLAAIEYPRGTSFVLAGALITSLASGYLGLAASGFAGAFFLAYLLLGLAIIHYTTRGFPWRPFALWALYAALLFINVWIAVVIAVLGLSDTLLTLRQRYPPPSLPPT